MSSSFICDSGSDASYVYAHSVDFSRVWGSSRSSCYSYFESDDSVLLHGATFRQSDVAQFRVVGIQRRSVDDIKFSMWNFINAVATFRLKEIASGSSCG